MRRHLVTDLDILATAQERLGMGVHTARHQAATWKLSVGWRACGYGLSARFLANLECKESDWSRHHASHVDQHRPDHVAQRNPRPAGSRRRIVIGIDTSILLRLRLDDDKAQSRRIDALLDEWGGAPESLLVTDVVLAEVVWTLRASFDQGKAAQLTAIRSLLDEAAFAFEDREAVMQATELFEHGSCGFSDCLVCAQHARHGCEFTATFVRGMRKLPDVCAL